MAKIVANKLAPKEVQRFSLAETDFEVPYETDDRAVISNAQAHPWLDVELPDAPAASGQFVDNQVPAADDPLSYVNDKSNDPEAVKAAQQEAQDVTPLAVSAGLDQNKAEFAGEGEHKVALTVAADDTDSTRRRRGKRED